MAVTILSTDSYEFKCRMSIIRHTQYSEKKGKSIKKPELSGKWKYTTDGLNIEGLIEALGPQVTDNGGGG